MSSSARNNDAADCYWCTAVVTPIVAPVVMVLMLLPPLLARAYVLTRLWAWYVAPVGVPQPTVSLAFGIFLIVELFRSSAPSRPSKEGDQPVWVHILRMTISPFVWLLLGWIGTFFL